MGRLSKLHEKYYARGLRVVAISDESVDTLKSKLVSERSARFWIGSDPQNNTMRSFVGEGGVGIPQFYLVDATGTVVSTGVPSEEVLEKLLGRIFNVALKRPLHQKLQRTQRAYEHGSYTIAFQTAGKFLADKDRTVVADAEFVREKVADYAEHRRQILEIELKTAEPGHAYGNLLLM